MYSVAIVLGVVWSSGHLVGQFENLSKKVDCLDSDMKAMAKEMREMVEANAKETRDKMEQNKCELIKKIDSKRGAFFLVRDYVFVFFVFERSDKLVCVFVVI